MDRGRPDKALEYTPSGELYQGSAIRKMRKAKGIGLRQLAALIPYDAGALSRVENNRAIVPKATLEKIAKILGVNAKELARKPRHPRLSKETTEAIEYPTTVDGKRELEELKADVREVKAEMAEVKAIVKELREIIRPSAPDPEIVHSMGDQSLRDVAAGGKMRDREPEGRISGVLLRGEFHGSVIMDRKKGKTLNFEMADAWDEVLTRVYEDEGELRLVMGAFLSITIPLAQYKDQVRPILEGESKEAADLIHKVLARRERCWIAFKRQVHKYRFRHIMPIKTLDWYKKYRFHGPDAWAPLLGGKEATDEQMTKHFRFIIHLLDTCPKYELGLLTDETGEIDFYNQFFWLVKDKHTVLYENFGEGEKDVQLTDNEDAERLSREFDKLWESKRVITDRNKVKELFEDHAKSLEKSSAIS